MKEDVVRDAWVVPGTRARPWPARVLLAMAFWFGPEVGPVHLLANQEGDTAGVHNGQLLEASGAQ